MSDRGTYITDFIYCSKCLFIVESAFKRQNFNFNGCEKFGLGSGFCYGRISGLYSGEEIDIFENEILPEIENNLCHKVRICIFPEATDFKVYKINE